jgi:hypothetical protein
MMLGLETRERAVSGSGCQWMNSTWMDSTSRKREFQKLFTCVVAFNVKTDGTTKWSGR